MGRKKEKFGMVDFSRLPKFIKKGRYIVGSKTKKENYIADLLKIHDSVRQGKSGRVTCMAWRDSIKSIPCKMKEYKKGEKNPMYLKRKFLKKEVDKDKFDFINE
jgi:hypothetical protein